MDNRALLLGGAAVVAVGAAFAAGHYMNQPATPPAAPPPAVEAPATEPAPQTGPAPTAEVPPPVVKAKPPKRVADYASGEDQYDQPPPPPPPPSREGFRDHPNPFQAQFNPFPIRHDGAGTIASPLTWSAQTALGHGREADLRISILVPEPSPNDHGQFLRRWGDRNQIDLIPEITRGTPVVIAGSVSVIVAVDPEILDLDTPATITIRGREGQRAYRSRDVAPARGEAWDSRGARWIFVPDEDFYRLLRDGADVSVTVHNRLDDREIRIPFNTDDFPPTARRFERDTYERMPQIAAEWDRARGDRPIPPPPPMDNRPPPPQEAPPFPRQGPPQGYPPQQPAPYGAQSPSGNFDEQGRGHRGRDHDANGSVPPNAAPATQAAKPAPVVVAAPKPAAPAPIAAKPVAPPSAKPVAPPVVIAKPAAPPPVIAKPAAPPIVVKPVVPPKVAPAATAVPPASANAAKLAAYRPPADNCGAAPVMPAMTTQAQATAATPIFEKKSAYMLCRRAWVQQYANSLSVLAQAAGEPGLRPVPALKAVSGGAPIAADYEKALATYDAQVTTWTGEVKAYNTAKAAPATTAP
jgi:hypothetical protein